MRKHYTMKAVAMMVLTLSFGTAQADTSDYGKYDFVVDGLYYDILTPDGDNPTCSVSDPDKEHRYSGDIVIPEQVEYDGKTYTVTAIGTCAFDSNENITSVTIPNTVTKIGIQAFSSSSLTEIEIPSSVVLIDEKAFYNSSIESITIPNSVTTIGLGAISSCGNLKKAVIGNSLKTISTSMFLYCPQLEEVTIGGAVETIELGAFQLCSNLKKINMLNPVPPTVGSYALYGVSKENATLTVPIGSAEAYRNAPEWKDFGNIIEEDLTGIDNNETSQCRVTKAGHGDIAISGYTGDVTVYSLSGATVKTARCCGNTVLSVPTGEVYIVRTGKTSVKIAM